MSQLRLLRWWRFGRLFAMWWSAPLPFAYRCGRDHDTWWINLWRTGVTWDRPHIRARTKQGKDHA